ncbi:MAG: hypothetical protein ACYC1Q_07385 [Bacteroidia bacterium]
MKNSRPYVNNKAQPNLDYKVHKLGSTFIPLDKTDLGEYSHRLSVVMLAGETYARVNGSYCCSKECHSS